MALLGADCRRGAIEPASRQGGGSDPLAWFLPSISHCVTSGGAEEAGGRRSGASGTLSRTGRSEIRPQSELEINPVMRWTS